MKSYTIRSCGGSAVTVEFEEKISPEVNSQVMSLNRAIKEKRPRGIVETIPSFRALTILFDPCAISEKSVRKIVSSLSGKNASSKMKSRIFKIPVCYGGEYGCDLEDVAKYHGITEEEVIRRHSGRDYLIYMLGFLPGFAYLGGLDEGLVTPRLENPRTEVPAGAVGIGGEQTGIYPLTSPGGWRLIGRTPLRPFNPESDPPILYRAGDYIRFTPIDASEYGKIERQVLEGKYKCETEQA